MIYIDDEYAAKLLDNSFSQIIPLLERGVELKKKNKVYQPLKPYLKFPKKKNRIIAMPAYVGGDMEICGIKWIASFPENISRNLRRANCVTILNCAKTGEPICIINSPELSIYRTACVSAMVLKKYLSCNIKSEVTIGILGYGPIGKKHEQMCYNLFNSRLEKIILYDVRKIKEVQGEKSYIYDSYEKVYQEADILITCTTADTPYLKCTPKKDRLTMNISLRDFDVKYIESEDTVFLIDDWNEVNRERTNIESLSKLKKINADSCIDLYDFIYGEIDLKKKALFFNPMGLAIFDVIVGQYMYNKALGKQEVN